MARPRGGPAFLLLSSTVYRFEMLLATLAIFAILYWRFFFIRDLNPWLTAFWILWPDLGSFIPIGLATRGRSDWPSWGPWLYNALHTHLIWIPIFAAWSIATGSIQWPLLGWAGHITADRSVGYYLRAKSSSFAQTIIQGLIVVGLQNHPEQALISERGGLSDIPPYHA